MTTKGYSTRTALWDDEDPQESPASQNNGRSSWRAPAAPAPKRAPSRTRQANLPGLSDEPDESDPLADDPLRPQTFRQAAPAARPPRGVSTSTSFGGVPTGRPAKPLERKRSKLMWYLLGACALGILGALTAAGIVVHRFLVNDAHFRIPSASSIQSTGLTEVSRAEVLPVFGEDVERNIFFVSLSQRRQQLESIPWVKQATVMRQLPNHLSVSIVERTPVAFVRVGQQVQLADADGVILSMPPAMMAQHHYSFPVVTGISADDGAQVRKTRMAMYMRFVGELDQNHQHISDQVSEIDLSDPDDLRAVMPEKGADVLAHFGDGQFLARWHIYQSHIAEWRQRYPLLIGVDLRYQGEVPLAMGTAAPQAPETSATTPPSAPTAAIPETARAAAPGQSASGKPLAPAKPAGGTPNRASAAHKPTLTAAQKKSAEARKKALETGKLKTEKLKAAKLKAARHKMQATKTAAAHPAAKPARILTQQGQ